MTLMEVATVLSTDRYTPEALKHIILAMACKDADLFAEVERDLETHMRAFPESRERFLTPRARGIGV
jgi:hypothetical protein